MDLLLLDLDDTLMDDRTAVQTALAALLDHHRHALPEDPDPLVVWRTLSARHWKRFESGELDFQGQRRERMREFLRQPLTDAEADAVFQPYQDAYTRAWSLFPEVPAFLERTARVSKLVVTNGFRDQQRQKVQAMGLDTHIQGIITPADCGAWKPDPGIFLAALKVRQALPSRCAMIGDDPIRDIAPALQLGMQASLVDRGASPHSLLDALDRLEI